MQRENQRRVSSSRNPIGFVPFEFRKHKKLRKLHYSSFIRCVAFGVAHGNDWMNSIPAIRALLKRARTIQTVFVERNGKKTHNRCIWIASVEHTELHKDIWVYDGGQTKAVQEAGIEQRNLGTPERDRPESTAGYALFRIAFSDGLKNTQTVGKDLAEC